MSQPKKILVAPLGWGLGHATRCIPIVRELQSQGATVVLASDGRALALLRQEFPQLESFELPSYNVEYRNNQMAWNMAWQLPKILRAIWREHQAVRQLSIRHGIDGIISDSRFGGFFSKKHCVFLTHQVNIQAPFLLVKNVVNFFNRLIINQFDECWIPDVPTTPNLSGGLSHPIKPSLKKKAKYIGALSRMVTGEMKVERYDAIAVLSGPEPQRTKLEKALIEQAGSISARFLIVQGRPELLGGTPIAPKKNIEIVPSMTAEALNQAILESGVFIGRSGYSTVMDLARLGKPALLIPTPGQTEQECLAAKFLEENIFHCQEQSELHLEQGIIEAKKRSGLRGDFFDEKALSSAIVSFLKAC
ncbi:MAG: glycosyltransferase [Saprospiraceae bacterium]|nr:glycosyltransferase [Saprospiraceae bacterium]